MGKFKLQTEDFHGRLEIFERVKGELSIDAPAILKVAKLRKIVFPRWSIRNRNRRFDELLYVRLTDFQLQQLSRKFLLHFEGTIEDKGKLPRGRYACSSSGWLGRLTLDLEGEIPFLPVDVGVFFDCYFSFYLGNKRVTEDFVMCCLQRPEWLSLGETDFLITDGDLDLARKIHERPVAVIRGSYVWFYDRERCHSQGGYLDFIANSIEGSRYRTARDIILVPAAGSVGEMLVELLSYRKLDEETAERLCGLSPEEMLAELLAREF